MQTDHPVAFMTDYVMRERQSRFGATDLKNIMHLFAALFGFAILVGCSISNDSNDSSGDTGFTVELSAADITQLTDFGERANFSPDGSRIVFVGENYGD